MTQGLERKENLFETFSARVFCAVMLFLEGNLWWTSQFDIAFPEFPSVGIEDVVIAFRTLATLSVDWNPNFCFGDNQRLWNCNEVCYSLQVLSNSCPVAGWTQTSWSKSVLAVITTSLWSSQAGNIAQTWTGMVCADVSIFFNVSDLYCLVIQELVGTQSKNNIISSTWIYVLIWDNFAWDVTYISVLKFLLFWCLPSTSP